MTRSVLAPFVIIAMITVVACTKANTAPTTKPSPVLPEFVVANRANSPFSPVVKVGNLLFVSGQIGVDSAAGGIAGETSSTMSKISALLKQAGSSLDRVAKCTVMLADMKDWAVMNDAYNKFFPQRRPARSSFGATGLAQNARVEIECVATVD